MAQITAGTLARDAARAQRRPVVYIARVICRDAPCGHSAQDFRGVAGTDIKDVVLRRVGAVDVVDRAAAYMLPVEIEKGAEDQRQTVLGEDIGFVVWDAYKIPVVGCGDARIRKFWIQHRQPGSKHEAREYPAGDRRFNAIITLVARDPKFLAIRGPRLSAANGIHDAGNKIRKRSFHAEQCRRKVDPSDPQLVAYFV